MNEGASRASFAGSGPEPRRRLCASFWVRLRRPVHEFPPIGLAATIRHGFRGKQLDAVDTIGGAECVVVAVVAVVAAQGLQDRSRCQSSSCGSAGANGIRTLLQPQRWEAAVVGVSVQATGDPFISTPCASPFPSTRYLPIQRVPY